MPRTNPRSSTWAAPGTAAVDGLWSCGLFLPLCVATNAIQLLRDSEEVRTIQSAQRQQRLFDGPQLVANIHQHGDLDAVPSLYDAVFVGRKLPIHICVAFAHQNGPFR